MMTVEDAIWTLQYVDPYDSAFSEAIDLAINALRSQMVEEDGTT